MAVDNACFNRIPSLKFVLCRWHTFVFSINRPGDLLTSNLVRVIACEVGNHLNNFDVLGTFRSRLMGQHLSDGQCDLRHLLLTLELMVLVGDMGHRASSVYQVWSSPVSVSVTDTDTEYRGISKIKITIPIPKSVFQIPKNTEHRRKNTEKTINRYFNKIQPPRSW